MHHDNNRGHLHVMDIVATQQSPDEVPKTTITSSHVTNKLAN